ncbi:unnamed protein product [Pleuronectes platessa]|uniref:Uncharacterized protein n=1 Tax=Pleuronectes platessa TaxID=8262 RepID=A0A9N7V102_PLEPL|nr:unnamed protein product [Pleuronectes platessa]
MQSISLPGLVLWLPLGSPAACLKHAQVPVARSQNVHIINSLHALRQQTSPSNAPATGMGGATGNPQSSSGRFIASYNLCSSLLHCHAPSHSYTGVVFSLCLELLLPTQKAVTCHTSRRQVGSDIFSYEIPSINVNLDSLIDEFSGAPCRRSRAVTDSPEGDAVPEEEPQSTTL